MDKRFSEFSCLELMLLDEFEANKVDFSSTIEIRVGFEIVSGGNRYMEASPGSHYRKRRRRGVYSVSLSFPCSALWAFVGSWSLGEFGHFLE